MKKQFTANSLQLTARSLHGADFKTVYCQLSTVSCLLSALWPEVKAHD